MKNLLNIDDKVKVVLQGEGKENVIGNGEIVTVTNIDKFPDGTIYYIGSFHVNCPEGGEGYDTTIQFKEGEYAKSNCIISEQCNSEEKKTLFNFGDAIAVLKAGRKVARKGWNGKDMFVVYQI